MSDWLFLAGTHLLLFLIGFLAGESRGEDHGKRVFKAITVGATTYYLRHFSDMPEQDAQDLAYWILTHGIRFRELVGKGKLLKRSWWDDVICDDWVRARIVTRKRNNRYVLTHQGIEFLSHFVPQHARTRTHK